MNYITLLDISNPRLIKETLNNLIDNHTQTLEQASEMLAAHLEEVNTNIETFKTETQEAMQQHIDETNTVIQEFKDSTNAAIQKHIADTDTIVKDFKEYAEGVLANVDSTIGDLGSVLDEINGEVI